MASTNKTSLGLTQYVLDDIPDMSDTNNDNTIITSEFGKRPEADSSGKYAKSEHADTADTSDNAKDAVEGGPLDARLETIEADIAKQAEDLDNFPVTGTAATAKKLETAREIALTGAVTGSGSFDGSGNLNIETSVKSGITGTDINTWYKIATANPELNSGQYPDIYGVFLVQMLYGDNLKGFGILRVHVRCHRPNNEVNNAQFLWDYTGNMIDANNFVLTYKDAKSPITIYCRLNNSNMSVKFSIIQSNENLRADETNFSTWTMFDNIPAEIFPPEGYTQLPSIYNDLKIGLMQTNKSPYNSGFNSSGSGKYMNVLQMKLKSTFMDAPVTVTLLKRQSNAQITVNIRWNASTNADPTLKSITKSGGPADVYIYKSATSTWNLLVKQVEANDETTINRVDAAWTHPGGFMDVSYPNTILDSLPSESATAIYYNPPEFDARYFKLTGGEVSGTTNFLMGYQVERISTTGSGNVKGFCKLVTITISKTWLNGGITIKFQQNYLPGSSTIYINFNGQNSLDPTLHSFYISGNFKGMVYLHKAAPSVWDIYIPKAEHNDSFIITGAFSEKMSMLSFNNTTVTDVPTDAIEATYYNPPEIDAQYLKKTGGIMSNGIKFDSGGTAPKNSPILRFETIDSSNKEKELRMQGWKGTSLYPSLFHFSSYYDGKENNVIIRGVRNGISDDDAVNVKQLNDAIAAIRAEFIGKTIAASIPNEAPTLETLSEEEEEITV